MEEVKEHVANLSEFRSLGPNELCSCVLEKLAEIVAEPQNVNFENSLRTGKVQEHWRKGNVTSICDRLSRPTSVCTSVSFLDTSLEEEEELVPGTPGQHRAVSPGAVGDTDQEAAGSSLMEQLHLE